MNQEQIDRMLVLLKATQEILHECRDSVYVMDVFYATAEYDGTECDGYCVMEDIDDLLEEIEDEI